MEEFDEFIKREVANYTLGLDPALESCVHIHVKDGKIILVSTHIAPALLKKNGVLHCKVEEFLTTEDFVKNHLSDSDELDSPNNLHIGGWNPPVES